MWFLSGLLVGVGVVGMLFGLPLALIGLALGVRNAVEGRRGVWLAGLGLGCGAALLTIDEVWRFEDDRCISVPGRGFDCPAAGANEIFWAGVVLVAVSLVAGLVTKLLRGPGGG
jgi:hypothetical protein